MQTTEELAREMGADPLTAEVPVVVKDRDKFIVLDDRELFTVHGAVCSCGNRLDRPWPENPVQTPPELVENTYEDCCEHQQAVLKAEPLGPCPNCGLYLARRTAYHRNTGAVEARWECQSCGEQRRIR